MENKKKERIANVLRKLDFVKWDRYFGYEEEMSIFGWIDRKEDSYKDFVLLVFFEKEISFATSSKKWSKRIAKIIDQEHLDCNRVEAFFDIPNVIKLDAKGSKRE